MPAPFLPHTLVQAKFNSRSGRLPDIAAVPPHEWPLGADVATLKNWGAQTMRRASEWLSAGLTTAAALVMLSLPALAQTTLPLDSEAARQHRSDETDMLARARAERQQHFASNPVPAGASRSDEDAAGDAIRDGAVDAEISRRIEEAQREAELDEISARLRARAARPRSEARVQPPPATPDKKASSQEPTAGSAPAAAVVEAPGAPATSASAPPPAPLPAVAAAAEAGRRTTIVLDMTPGHTGIRRHNPTADPILCIADTCWISRGTDQDARPVRRSKALGPMNTLGARAGDCNDRTICVFRNVDLGAATASIQPVDLRILRHDRRAERTVSVDAGCRIEGDSVSCPAPQSGPDYSLWLVPEPVARLAGGLRLQNFASRLATLRTSRLAVRKF